jgi:hypothetical protein
LNTTPSFPPAPKRKAKSFLTTPTSTLNSLKTLSIQYNYSYKNTTPYVKPTKHSYKRKSNTNKI